MKHILIIEDDESIAELERDYLELNEFTCDIAARGTTGLEMAMANEYDLIISDIMLPGMDGFCVIEELRKKKQVPVIFVSAKDSDFDKIKGLSMGVDDYITKPFSPNELVARVKAHIQRYEIISKKNETSKDKLTFGELEIDRQAYTVKVNGTEITLTVKEFELLYYLAANKGRAFSKEQLFDRIWGMDALGDVSTVTVHIQRIRDKVCKNMAYIETVWGVGYKFSASPSQAKNKK